MFPRRGAIYRKSTNSRMRQLMMQIIIPPVESAVTKDQV